MDLDSEVIFIGENAISVSKKEQNSDEDSKRILSCVFVFEIKSLEFAIFCLGILDDLVGEVEHLFVTNSNALIEILDSLESTPPKDWISYKAVFENIAHSNEVENLRLFIRSNANKILHISDSISANLPFSFNFIFKDFSLLDKGLEDRIFDGENHDDFINPRGKIPTMPNISNIHDCRDNIAPFVTFHKDLYTIKNLASMLLDKKSITLRRNGEIFTLSISACQMDLDSHVVFCDLYNAQSFLRLDDSQKISLASLEKPFVRVQSKEVFSKYFHDSSCAIFASLSNDLVLLSLFHYLAEHEIVYLFYSKNHGEILLDYHDCYPSICASKNRFVTTQSANTSIERLSFDRGAKSLFDIFMINKADNARLCVYLSSVNNSYFLIEEIGEDKSSFKEIINVLIPNDIFSYLNRIYSYKSGDRLLRNFAKENEALLSSWNLSQKQLEQLGLLEFGASCGDEFLPSSSKNLLDIFSVIKKIFGFDVLELANLCLRDRGPRIDYKLVKIDDEIHIDVARIIRSLMSFHLAGVERELLCYGVLDSMADFIGTLCADMQVNYGINEVFVCGDLLLQKPFFDRIMRAIPKNIHLTLPVEGSVDVI